MQKLNIPLSRHTKTTRPLRQVVWLLGMSAVVLVLLAWRAGELWFSRDSILQAAPEGTILAIQLEITDKSWPQVQKILAKIPLISDRSLDVVDIASFIHGEVAVFVTGTGERAVAIRTDEQNLPTELLNALSITKQEITTDIILLSGTLLPVSGISSSARHPLFASLSRNWLGRVELPDIGISGALYEKDGQIEIAFRNKDKGSYPKENLKQAMLAIAGQKNDLSLNFEEGLGTFAEFFNEEWSVLVETDDAGDPALLFMTESKNMTQGDLLSLLQLMGAYLSPKIQETALPDGSTLREVIVEPDLVTVEEIQLGQMQVLHVLGMSGRSIYASLINGKAVFATSEAILQTYNLPNNSDSSCEGNILHVNPSALLGSIATTSYDPTIQVLQSLLFHFSAISLEMKKYSSLMLFCST